MLEVSRSGYYKWRKERQKNTRQNSDRVILTHIRALHKEHDQTLGSPRMHRELVEQGVKVGRHRVARIMHENRIWAQRKRRYRVTTDSNHDYPIPDNLLRQDFTADAPNQVWVGDITYVSTDEGWLYVAILLDLYSRRIVGWAAAPHLRAKLPLEALRSALALRSPEPGLIHHSDRGIQYACGAYRRTLDRHGVVASMSRKGNCWDNAVAESFFSTLKVERVHRRSYKTRAEAEIDIRKYINYYNTRRRHSFLGLECPLDYELQRQAA